MISKYDGSCCFCHGRTVAGKDEYDFEGKISYHVKCREKAESAPSREQFELAEALGFVAPEFIAAMAGNWILWDMRSKDRGAPARRVGTETRSRQNETLF